MIEIPLGEWRARLLAVAMVAALMWWPLGLSYASELELLHSLSPKLQKFIKEHIVATQILTNSIATALSNKVAQVYYFYSDDDSVAWAAHYYPAPSEVVIMLRENQQPVDEFACLIFEILNSAGEAEFAAICRRAAAGTVSQHDFAVELLRTEFKAMKAAQSALKTLRVSPSERANSSYFAQMLDCPDTFEEFLPYLQKDPSRKRDLVKEYELKYDSLRQP